MELHAGFYRFWAQHKLASVGSSRPEDAMAQAISSASPPKSENGSGLGETDRMKFVILTHAKFAPGTEVNTGDMRTWLVSKFRKADQLADKAQTAARELTAALVLTEASKLSKKNGRKVLWYMKRSWEECVGNKTAADEIARLQVGRSSFE